MNPDRQGSLTEQWCRMPLCEQLANIGAEFERALSWRDRQNEVFFQKAFDRVLELLDLSLLCCSSEGCLRELARVREALVDFFIGSNQYGSQALFWKDYFMAFSLAARRIKPA